MNINIYTFSYLGDKSVYSGVLAQEILLTNPEAIYINEAGFLSVDYQAINIKFEKLF